MSICCRRCGASVHESKGWLQRVNPKGEEGIWECTPSCDSTLTQEEKIVGAIYSQEEVHVRIESR